MGMSAEIAKDSNGNFRTISLLVEPMFNLDMAVYTTRDEDWYCERNGKTYPSLKRLYLECEDPTEYEFATTYFYNWEHFCRVRESKKLTHYFDAWRTELEMKLRAKGLKAVIKRGLSGNSVEASKYLVEAGWVEKKTGRPSKQQIQAEAAKRAALAQEFANDLERFKVVK